MPVKRIKARVEIKRSKVLFITRTKFNIMIRKGDNQPKMYHAEDFDFEEYENGYMLTIQEGITGSSMGMTSRGTVSGRVYARKPKPIYVDEIEIVDGDKVDVRPYRGDKDE